MQLELKRLQKHLGMTFVFVTHDQEEALTMSDRIAVFNQGRLEQLGSASAIYHQPRTAFVADFIGEANLLTAEAIARSGTMTRLRVEGGLELEIPTDRWPAGGSKVVISLRPEKILVSKRPLEAEAIFTARVTDELFQGALDRLHLQTESGTRLTALVANESALREAIHAGDAVWCGVHADDIAVVGPA
jgi:spermidine/putrescine transport system ATP-binding protein